MNKHFTASLIALTLAAFAYYIGGTTTYALIDPDEDHRSIKRAPIEISGEDVYIVWTNDKNMPNNNSEVMFRASTDRGATFGDKINLSNTTTADSFNAEIAAADGDEVIVTWWEGNQTNDDEPVFRASVDNGLTFGPLMYLSTNGTLAHEEVEEAVDN